MTNPTAAKDGTDRAYYPQEDQDGRRRLAERYPVSEHANCMAISDRTLGCTRPTGHDGPHVAHVSSREAAQIWPNTRMVAPNPPAPTQREETRNSLTLRDFAEYCCKHPSERFWQALRNWSGYGFVFVSNSQPEGDLLDTFYWEAAAPAPIGLDTPPQCPTCGSPNPDYCIGHCPDNFHDGRTPQMGYAAPADEVREIPPATPQGKGAEGGRKEAELIDRAWIAGAQFGFNCCGSNEDLSAAINARMRDIHDSGGSQAIGESAVPTLCVRCNGPLFARRDCHVCGAPLCDHNCEEWHLEKDCQRARPASEPTGDATQVTAEEAREWLRSPEIFQMRWTNSLNNQLSCEDRECLLLAAFANRALASRTAKEGK